MVGRWAPCWVGVWGQGGAAGKPEWAAPSRTPLLPLVEQQGEGVLPPPHTEGGEVRLCQITKIIESLVSPSRAVCFPQVAGRERVTPLLWLVFPFFSCFSIPTSSILGVLVRKALTDAVFLPTLHPNESFSYQLSEKFILKSQQQRPGAPDRCWPAAFLISTSRVCPRVDPCHPCPRTPAAPLPAVPFVRCTACSRALGGLRPDLKQEGMEALEEAVELRSRFRWEPEGC